MIQACYGESPPPVVLIGHGVGGAIAVHTASNVLLPTTVGLVAIDVVEGKKAPEEAVRQLSRWRALEVSPACVGSAMEALHSIQNFLKGRPKSFKSMDHAIEWRWGLGTPEFMLFGNDLGAPLPHNLMFVCNRNCHASTHSKSTQPEIIAMDNEWRPNYC